MRYRKSALTRQHDLRLSAASVDVDGTAEHYVQARVSDILLLIQDCPPLAMVIPIFHRFHGARCSAESQMPLDSHASMNTRQS